MSQTSLFLDGCAIYRYSWGTKSTVVSFDSYIALRDILFYIFTFILSKFHRTPSAQILHFIVQIPGLLHSITSVTLERSACRHRSMAQHELSSGEDYLQAIILPSIIKEPGDNTRALSSIFFPPVYFFVDIYRLSLAIIWPFIIFARRLSFWLWRGLEHHPMLDLHCISWTLRTSLNGPIRLSALNYLATTILAHFDSTLVADCFDILIGCISHRRESDDRSRVGATCNGVRPVLPPHTFPPHSCGSEG